ncbi:IS5 family transposase [Thiobacillus sp.]
MKQLSLAATDFVKKSKQTRREKFLIEMEAVVPWARLLGVIEPVYPKAGNGRRPSELPVMLRIHFMHQWFNYSDATMEEALHDIPLLRRFAGLDAGSDTVPDETTILNFRHLLQTHRLSARLFAEVNSLLAEKGLLLKEGTTVDATLIEDWVARKAKPGRSLDAWTRNLNHAIASIRAIGEHPFRILKRQFGYTKVRYRGLEKNTAQLVTLFALGNLYQARRALLAAG